MDVDARDVKAGRPRSGGVASDRRIDEVQAGRCPSAPSTTYRTVVPTVPGSARRRSRHTPRRRRHRPCRVGRDWTQERTGVTLRADVRRRRGRLAGFGARHSCRTGRLDRRRPHPPGQCWPGAGSCRRRRRLHRGRRRWPRRPGTDRRRRRDRLRRGRIDRVGSRTCSRWLDLVVGQKPTVRARDQQVVDRVGLSEPAQRCAGRRPCSPRSCGSRRPRLPARPGCG